MLMRSTILASGLLAFLAGVGPAHSAAPAITSLSPNSAIVLSDSVTITINGSGFRRNATVRWGSVPLSMNYVNENRLTATIAREGLALPRSADIQVSVPGVQGGLSNGIPFTVVHPVPGITSISPTHATLGVNGFKLTVNGMNFLPSGMTVRWAMRPGPRPDSARRGSRQRYRPLIFPRTGP